jgi:hypothetical protein
VYRLRWAVLTDSGEVRPIVWLGAQLELVKAQKSARTSLCLATIPGYPMYTKGVQGNGTHGTRVEWLAHPKVGIMRTYDPW